MQGLRRFISQCLIHHLLGYTSFWSLYFKSGFYVGAKVKKSTHKDIFYQKL